MRNTIVMIVLAILAAATWVATWERQDATPPVERVKPTGPLGYYARGARLSGTDEQGRPTYHIFAERLDEVPVLLAVLVTWPLVLHPGHRIA